MRQEVTNFARFYAVFNKLPYEGEREDLKCSLVRQYTNNRTESLKGMTRTEYDTCCAALEELSGQKDERKRKRSTCLKLMQKLGIDTTDWTRINSFCQDRRIAGKPFSKLRNTELDDLATKLRGIERKGGFRQKNEDKPNAQVTCFFTMNMDNKGINS